MSQAPSRISTGSQGPLCPDDSISQVITPYLDQTFHYYLESHNDESTASHILSSAPLDLLITTISDASGITLQHYSSQAGTTSASITSQISSIHLSIPAFLQKPTARHDHSWLTSHATEIFQKCKYC